MDAYKKSSTVSNPASRVLSANSSSGFSFVPFETQPKGRHYAIQATLRLNGDSKAGFRVLSSDKEYTDIYFDSANEVLSVDRSHSSLISSCASLGSVSR